MTQPYETVISENRDTLIHGMYFMSKAEKK